MNRALTAIASPLLLLCAPLIAIAAPQQQQPPPLERSTLVHQTPTISTLHIESRLVSVALNVVDQQGVSVQSLKAGDFDLTEDNRPQRIAIFDKESSTPLEIVLTIDASGSVFTDDQLERAAAVSFVKSLLREQDRIDLIAFSDNVDEIASFTNDPKRIDNGLDRIKHGDATALYDAVSLASQRLAETPSVSGARRVIVLITDGENTTRHGSYDAAIEQAERAGAMIYPLIIVPVAADAGRNTGGEHALIQMANDTGGTYYYVAGDQDNEPQRDLASAFAHLSGDLRTQYILGYYAPQRGVDSSGLRHIHLQLKDPALRARYTLRYRTVYYANR